MRFDVRTLGELKDAIEAATPEDRLVLFFKNAPPLRFRVWPDRLEWQACNEQGRLKGEANDN